MIYLKDNQFYNDRYDLLTVKECLAWYQSLRQKFKEKQTDKEFQMFSQEKFDKEVHKILSYTINIIKGERFRNKAKTINQWIARDSQIQERFDAAKPPEMYCASCKILLVVNSKDFLDLTESKSQVLFILKCETCNCRKAYYEDGTEWIYKKPICPKCLNHLESSTTQNNNILTTKDICTKCNYKKEDMLDLNQTKKERALQEKKDQELLNQYKDEFCLNEKNGPQYLNSLDRILSFAKELQLNEEKENNPIYKKIKAIKILKLSQVKERIEKTVLNERYIDLRFSKPEIGKYVVVEFSVTDSQETRHQRESERISKKLISNALENSNWRLTSDGIHYRLGIITGKLKAYETEEDLLSLVTKHKG